MSAENPTEKTAQHTSKRKSQRMLLLIAAVCLAPFVASFALYYFWQPSGRVNYGELVDGVTLPAGDLALVNGKPFDFAQLRGRWIYVTVDSGACDDYCQKKLWKMRQVRLTQGKYPERIERAWLVNDTQAVAATVLKEFDGTWVASAKGNEGKEGNEGNEGNAVLKLLPYLNAQRDHIYLVDPLGNVVLRYPKDADPSRMKKDLTRLLKVSRIG